MNNNQLLRQLQNKNTKNIKNNGAMSNVAQSNGAQSNGAQSNGAQSIGDRPVGDMKMQYIQQMKQMQQLKKMEFIQQMQSQMKQYTKNLLEPIKMNDNNNDVEQKYKIINETIEKEKKYNNIIDNKTGNILKIDNTPYKQIMTNKQYGGEDYKKTHKIETFQNDIIVHKVTEQDKDISIFNEQLNGIQSQVTTHDNTLKKLYSSEKQEEYTKQFEYRKKCILNTTDVNQLEHTDVKKDRIKFYEKQQKDLEIDNAKVLNVVRDLKNTGILTEEQINETLKMM